MSPEEEEPFLLTDRALKDLDRDYPREPGAQSGSHYSPAAVLLIHLGIIAIYTITSISIIRSQRSCLTIYPPVAIDNLDVSYTTTLFRRLNGTPYAGPPSAETNAAWNALMAPMHISVSKVELDRDNQASVALPEKGGYLGWMGVFHQLHCIVSSNHSHYNRFSDFIRPI